MQSIAKDLLEINIKIERLENLLLEKDSRINRLNSYDEYMFITEFERTQLQLLRNQKRMIMPYELSEITDGGRIMLLKSFIKRVKDYAFKDHDGMGFYSMDGKESNIIILPSDVKRKMVRKDFEYIVWYKEKQS